MKLVDKEELDRIAEKHGMTVEIDDISNLPLLIKTDNNGNVYGLEATEKYDGKYEGFKYFGDPRYQKKTLGAWNDLVEPEIDGDLLTIKRAKELIGKTVRLSYCDVNNGEEKIQIISMIDVPTESIGQDSEKRLNFYAFSPETIRMKKGDVVVDKLSGDFDPSKFHVVDSEQIKQFGYNFPDKYVSLCRYDLDEKYLLQFPTYEDWVKDAEEIKVGEEMETELSSWIYEWQGIFRRGSGAERLFVEEVID